MFNQPLKSSQGVSRESHTASQYTSNLLTTCLKNASHCSVGPAVSHRTVHVSGCVLRTSFHLLLNSLQIKCTIAFGYDFTVSHKSQVGKQWRSTVIMDGAFCGTTWENTFKTSVARFSSRLGDIMNALSNTISGL